MPRPCGGLPALKIDRPGDRWQQPGQCDRCVMGGDEVLGIGQVLVGEMTDPVGDARDEQERCLRPYPVITVALDNDAVGTEKSVRICERLKKNHRVSKARLIVRR